MVKPSENLHFQLSWLIPPRPSEKRRPPAPVRQWRQRPSPSAAVDVAGVRRPPAGEQVSINGGTPKAGWFRMEHPIHMDDLGIYLYDFHRLLLGGKSEKSGYTYIRKITK